MMSSSPVMKTDRDRVSAIEGALVGSHIASVEYRQTEHGGLLRVPVENCHEVDLDIFLRMSSGIVNITWDRDDLVEGLSISIPEEVVPQGEMMSVVVSDSPQWLPLIGQEISCVAFGWQISESGCPESLWSLRVEFATGASVVFALGERDDGLVPSYFPDSLLVIFDEQAARSYAHLGAIGNAWGDRSGQS
jgi:hypothetical protein